MNIQHEVKSGYDHLISVLNDFKSTTEHDTAMLTSKVDSLNLHVNLNGFKQEISDVITTHLNTNFYFLQDDKTSVLSAKVDSLISKFDEIKHQMSDIINSNFLQDDAKNQTKMGLDELTDIDKKMWDTGILS